MIDKEKKTQLIDYERKSSIISFIHIVDYIIFIKNKI